MNLLTVSRSISSSSLDYLHILVLQRLYTAENNVLVRYDIGPIIDR